MDNGKLKTKLPAIVFNDYELAKTLGTGIYNLT